MDFLKKAADMAQDYAAGQNQNQNQNNQNNQNQGQSYHSGQNQPSQGYQQGGNFGGFAGEGQNNQNQNQFQGQGQGQGGFGGGQPQQQQQYGGSGGGGGAAADFFNKTGGEEFNRPHGGGGAGGGFGVPNIDQSSALAAAKAEGGEKHGDDSLFSSAFSMLKNFSKDDKDDIDEDDVMRKHDQAYNQNQAGNMSANSMGAAAALQAFKMFTSGQQQQQPQQQQSSGGNMQSKIIGMALAEAAKMFDQSGGAASGNKQDAVNSAGATVMKLLIKSQFSGTTGGGNSGGLGQLMSMASKFM